MTLFSSTVDTMTASFTSTIDTSDTTTQPSITTNICAVSPSSAACMMAIEDDETGMTQYAMYILHTDTKILAEKRLSGLCMCISSQVILIGMHSWHFLSTYF